MRRHLYSADWEAVRAVIRARSGGRCECEGECGLHRKRRCVERTGAKAKWARGRVVLTAAHINHDKQDNRSENLRAMCNRCHLRMDGALRAERRRRKDELSGQSMLFPVTLTDRVLA